MIKMARFGMIWYFLWYGFGMEHFGKTRLPKMNCKSISGKREYPVSYGAFRENENTQNGLQKHFGKTRIPSLL